MKKKAKKSTRAVKPKKHRDEYFIKSERTIKEEYNDAGECVSHVEGKISKNGKDWEDALFIMGH
jgi:hypothetical protein